ncbi:autotransporter outer membrane beta-barrel domain-containing protein [Prochlorococcus marinus]|uniref:autotransporter outer membrane beta-barrel domain-containing protein n=1 Tax=Prochlorococcus marinus TaxID=1219 RepID=UPI0022B3668E|nr:autotransporter outer membrane beta-barrel domain-containing protein [Prochlorococcus marinus]
MNKVNLIDIIYRVLNFLGPKIVFIFILFLPESNYPASANPAPNPSTSSTVGSLIRNPKELLVDEEYVLDINFDSNDATYVSGQANYSQFVFTNDLSSTEIDNLTTAERSNISRGNVFMVREKGDKFYQNYNNEVYEYTIDSYTDAVLNVSPTYTLTTNNDIPVDAYKLAGKSINAWQTYEEWESTFFPWSSVQPVQEADVNTNAASGISYVRRGANGSNGGWGAIFFPPGDGSPGATGPSFSHTISGNPSYVSASQYGVEVGSIGGKGGDGGAAYACTCGGGDGAGGGAGGNVSLTITNGMKQIATTGSSDHGVFAYSKSGKGGTGGGGYGAFWGGSGGGSPNSGNVTIDNSALLVSTSGDESFGIYGFSVSGQGGSGGAQYGLAGSSGSGAGASKGGNISITNQAGAQVQTDGSGSYGLLAQSVGGTGGSGGASGNLFYSGSAKGDNGGQGGNTFAKNSGEILTQGDRSVGIFVQSTGGGGGNGGDSWGLIAVGGSADAGGVGGDVEAINGSTGIISTTGKSSTGMFVQSVGGSGGNGGDSGGLVSLGGSGSNGAKAGSVDVDNDGTITTDGSHSRGLFAQSVGGGGGSGGRSGGMISVGGSGSGGGDGEIVDVRHIGSIQTKGDFSEGVFAQSVGGGGGDGGSSTGAGPFLGVAVGGNGSTGGKGGNVNIALGGSIKTGQDADGGYKSTGLFAQSVGGGGGTGGGSISASVGIIASGSFSIGGTGGEGGDGGEVNLSTYQDKISNISTRGDHSTGVFLQSVGGGGGDGGYAYAFAASAGPVSGSVTVGVGGEGSAAGEGGEVNVGSNFPSSPSLSSTYNPTVGFTGSIITDGRNSTGLFAQSVGGGGGNGGMSISGAASFGAAGLNTTIAVGGNGGGGGDGGEVSVSFGDNTSIETKKVQSTALLVQSVGGGGGNGGATVSAGLGVSVVGSVNVAVGSGGNASVGGDGGKVVAVTRSGTITTKGLKGVDGKHPNENEGNSPGIIVQSIGGGGGNGGYSIAGGIAAGGAVGGNVTVGLGGNGGGGGDGADVFAQLGSNVVTESDNSSGILIQSVGGGGGNGGFSISVSGQAGGSGAGSVNVGLGGSGSGGGKGNKVTASSAGVIQTKGSNSTGFLAQSIGGGGGNGGYNVAGALSVGGGAAGSIGVGLGGEGGTGNRGGNVEAKTTGSIFTGVANSDETNSPGIVVQSIGGGGGNGGFNITARASLSSFAAGGVDIGLGGNGGTGSDAGNVDLTVDNNVTTYGKDSTAITAQSIGGGGGNGGFNVSAGAAIGMGGGAGNISVGLGGEGAAGGKGSNVSSIVNGTITTHKENSTGIIVQSVGGGGGNGAFNVTGAISVGGIGSGGVNVGLGGNAGNGSSAGNVTGTTEGGSVITHGDSSPGFIVQSIGGGGGNGGFNIVGSLSGSSTGSGSINVGLGGDGGSGSSPGVVNATSESDITTHGDESVGFLAQSVGGGGGNGAFNITSSASAAGKGSGNINIGLGGDGGSASNANTVTLTSKKEIITNGSKSNAITAQSIGGGGGNGGFNVSAGVAGSFSAGSGTISVGLGGSGGGGGHGSSVIVDSTGKITTSEEMSDGILAQSVGGGGGNGGFNVSAGVAFSSGISGGVSVGLGGSAGSGGNAGTVDVTVNNEVITNKDNSNGIIAQSIGGGGGKGAFDVSSTITGGTKSGALSVGLGGSGGDGGDSSDVNADVTGDITTSGKTSIGLLAQSVGGGGGAGGFSVTSSFSGSSTASFGGSVNIGGSGGGGGNSTNVNVTKKVGNIETKKQDSPAVVAQSIAGGGGIGAIAVDGSIVVSKGAALGASVGIGGSGGDGGSAGIVSNIVSTSNSAYTSVGFDRNSDGFADANGYLKTSGNNSAGMSTQSIGGGGGNGGFNISGAVTLTGNGSGSVGVGLGGSGGKGGSASNVISSFTGEELVTNGIDSPGIKTQSIGGGGGNGALNITGTVALSAKTGSGSIGVGIGGSGGDGGSAGSVVNTSYGDIKTNGLSNSPGIVLQSIGGGGGNGALNITGNLTASKETAGNIGIGFGGSGGNQGTPSSVQNTSIGNVVTKGSNSPGVLLQSIGEGGGNGAINVTGNITASLNKAGAIGLGFGGSGGAGAPSGVVENDLKGDVTTSGSESPGVDVQSIGGGGGSGGLNIGGSVAISMEDASGALGIGFGGSGGTAGWANTVKNDVEGIVQTNGDDSIGILSQSVGGGGGSGALNIVGGLGISTPVSKTGSGSLALGFGGSGSSGGTSSYVTNSIKGSISTKGVNSAGIFSQSIGGGGGNGGLNISAAVNLTKEDGGALALGIGGMGGGGGNSGSVTTTFEDATATSTNNKSVTTEGFNSPGIAVKSIGGGGGNGGINVSGAVNLTGKKGASVGVGVGGFGGGSGNSSAVTLISTGNIETQEGKSSGIIAQSVGGGGGNGGLNITGTLGLSTGDSTTATAASLGIGGFGGNGGNAGNVNITHNGNIRAAQKLEQSSQDLSGSYGVIANSQGGGGGLGAINIASALQITSKKNDGAGLVVGVGGYGGGGGNSGDVSVTINKNKLKGLITTKATGKAGVAALSIGGGGGAGGFNISGGITADTSINVGVGGSGANGGTSGNVKVDINSDITIDPSTSGTDYDGLISFDNSQANPVFLDDYLDKLQEVTSWNTLESIFETKREILQVDSAGLLAQSIGGGGGKGALNVTGGINFSGDKNSLNFGIGGAGGTGSTSGEVDVDLIGNISTTGKYVSGITAQSVGGGGGNAGMNINGGVSMGDEDHAAITVGIGGTAGDGATSGQVSVTHTGSISTEGSINASGIKAESLGGGGGIGGVNINGLIAKGSNPITLNVGGSGGNGSKAGYVEVIRGTSELSTGKISTKGKVSPGIEASSIGGGGGKAGMTIAGTLGTGLTGKSFQGNISIGGNGGEGSDGNIVKVDNNSEIETTGINSHGVIAQSIGGGGGNANYNLALLVSKNSQESSEQVVNANVAIGGQPGSAGNGANVSITQKGNITTSKKNSHALFGQSIGGGGGNTGIDLVFEKTLGSQDRTSLEFTMGRTGGTGGTGGNVEIAADGTYITNGDDSHGLFAQSIGKGGGNSSLTSIAIEKETNPVGGKKEEHSAKFKMGAVGGQGGSAGDITVTTTSGSKITTQGWQSHGIFAQTTGGGGGNATSSIKDVSITKPDVSVAIGGQGGQGGVSGDIDIISDADIETSAIKSHGIFAQSIGGGGGQGSHVYTAAPKASKYIAWNASVGGNGGSGNTSGEVTVSQSGSTTTNSDSSHGIYAKSVGGGGGDGGTAINILKNLGSVVDTSTTNNSVVTVAVGGTGGDSSHSEKVEVTNNGTIKTVGNNSYGIYAKSVGGGGGKGGMSIAGTLMRSKTELNFSIGGFGGTGSNSDSVVVRNLGTNSEIVTYGEGSHGIVAKSIGGGGGEGAASYSITPDLAATENTSTEINATASIGGAGGSGGLSKDVTVDNEGDITIKSMDSYGIYAESIGGGGGSGGMSIAGNIQIGGLLDNNNANKLSKSTMSIGGFGGDGNTSGNVTVTNTGTITIENKDGKNAIYAQSIGGGGGNGSFAINATPSALNPKNPYSQLTNVSIGGFGGTGANSGDVTVTNEGTGKIISYADNSYAILAQSIGGGGGNSSISYGAPAWTASDWTMKTIVGGGSVGTSGKVSVNIKSGSIELHGKNSNAYIAQSINGGGGNVTTLLDISEKPNPPSANTNITYTLGSQNITNLCTTTDENFIDNICSWEETDSATNTQTTKQTPNLALKDLTANSVTDISNSDNISHGERSTIIRSQSIGGGGGTGYLDQLARPNAPSEVNIELGAQGVETSHGNKINSTINGITTLNGKESTGILLQSIGGGGGEFKAYNEDVGVESINETKKTSIKLGSINSLINNGDEIRLENNDSINISGDDSQGIVLQSIGGGGGLVKSYGFDSSNVTFGGTNNSSGNGGSIQLINNGNITQSSENSFGIIAQSIGGGGGIVFTDLKSDNIALNLNPSIGSGSSIQITQEGDINITKDSSIGILAQSLGGGGGIVDKSFIGSSNGSGNAGNVVININGNIDALTEDSKAIYAQSDSNTSSGDISITLKKDKYIYVSDKGTAIQVADGKDNNINIFGNIKALTSYPAITSKINRCSPALWICNPSGGRPDGYALKGGSGNEVVQNESIFYGNVDLDTGKGVYTNTSTGNIFSADKFVLGSTIDSKLLNEGLISPGGTYIYETEIGGNYVQSKDANLDIDLDFYLERDKTIGTKWIDVLDVREKANLLGNVNLLTRSIPLIKPGYRELPFVRTLQGVENENLILNVPPSAVVRYGIISDPYIDSSALRTVGTSNTSLALNVNFSGFGDLNSNQVSIGDYINRVQEYGPTQDLSLFISSVFALPDSSSLKIAYDSISPEVFSSNTRNIYNKSSEFLESLVTCNSKSDFKAFGEDSCVWYEHSNNHTKFSNTFENLGFKNDTLISSVGMQWELENNNFFGLGVESSSYENLFSNVSSSIDGVSTGIGFTYKKLIDNTKLSFGLNYGEAKFETIRTNVFPLNTEAKSETEYTYFTSRLEASKVYFSESINVIPAFALEYSQVHGKPFDEVGSGPLNLEVESNVNEFFKIAPSIQIGKSFEFSNIFLQPKIKYGYNRFIGDSYSVSTNARFQGAPDEVNSFTVKDSKDREFHHLTFGLDLKFINDVHLNLQYKTLYSDNSFSNQTSLGFSLPF